MKTSLYVYQRVGVDKLKELRRAILSDEPGLGKSVQFLTFAEELEALPAIIICPASLKINWVRQIETHLGKSYRVHVMQGLSPESKKGRVPDFTIVNYDLLRSRMNELLELDAKSIVADEGHYLCNRSSKRTKCVRELFKHVKNAVIMTGTPVTNRPCDLYPLINMLYPKKFPSFMAFAQRYAKPKKKPWGWVFEGAQRLDELHEVLSEFMIRRRKSEVLKDLPPKRKLVVPLELGDRKKYEGAKKDFMSWLSKNAPEKVSGAERAKGLGLANHLKQLVGILKIPSVIEWVENFLEEGGGKLILFAFHREVIEKLHDHFGDESVKIYGGLNDKVRQKAFDAFNSDKNVKVLVGQIESAGQGWSCVSTSDCAFAELDWRFSLIEQATDRTHGVKRGVEDGHSTSWFLLADNTIEIALARTIEKKQKIARAIVDGGEGEIMDVFTEFCKAVRNG